MNTNKLNEAVASSETVKIHVAILRDVYGHTPYIVGVDGKEVFLKAGTVGELVEDYGQDSIKIRFAGTKPGCFWTLNVGRAFTNRVYQVFAERNAGV